MKVQSQTRFYPRSSIFLLIALAGYYLFENFASNLSSIFLNNVIKPFFWLCISYIVIKLPKVRFKGKLRHAKVIYGGAFSFAVLLIILQILGGLVDGFGLSPYSHSLKGIIINVFVVGTTLVGRELVRNYLVNSMAKESYPKFILISLFLTVLSFPLSKFTSLQSVQNTVIFSAQFLAPEFAKSLMATYLVFLGGPPASIIYLGVLQGFHWLSPILPDLQWLTAAVIGILTPMFSLMGMQTWHMDQTKRYKRRDKIEDGLGGWIAVAVCSIALIWFVVGVFPIYPSVIATGSMKPLINPGDVILVKKLQDTQGLARGDIIQFRRDDIVIAHRIIEIIRDKGIQQYRTKGDNNSVQDSEPVQAGQIKGKIIKVVPKIGWPTLLIKKQEDSPKEKVEF